MRSRPRPRLCGLEGPVPEELHEEALRQILGIRLRMATPARNAYTGYQYSSQSSSNAAWREAGSSRTWVTSVQRVVGNSGLCLCAPVVCGRSAGPGHPSSANACRWGRARGRSRFRCTGFRRRARGTIQGDQLQQEHFPDFVRPERRRERDSQPGCWSRRGEKGSVPLMDNKVRLRDAAGDGTQVEGQYLVRFTTS